jgi:hypothetical protein
MGIKGYPAKKFYALTEAERVSLTENFLLNIIAVFTKYHYRVAITEIN